MRHPARRGERFRERGEGPRLARRPSLVRVPSVARANGVTVRRATIADLETVVALRLALLYEDDSGTQNVDLPLDIEHRMRRLAASQLVWDREVTLLGVVGGECVGVLRCVETAGSPLVDPTSYGYVASAYVRPAGRRSGTLRALLAAADIWCRSRGLDEMRLHCGLGNRTGHAAWKALGFAAAEVMRVREVPPDAICRR